MNKNLLTILFIVVGFFLFGSVSEARAGTIWYFFGVSFDSQAEETGGFSSTYITYDLYDYYDPGVHSLLHYTNPHEVIDVDGGGGVNDYLYAYYPGFRIDITNDDYRPNKLICVFSQHGLYPVIVPTPYQGQSYDPYNIASINPVFYTTPGTTNVPDNFAGNNYSNGNFWVTAASQICIQTPTVNSVTFETINSTVSNDNPANLGGGSRIFPGKQSHNDTTNRRTVKVKAQLAPSHYENGQPVYTSGTKVYFRNFDVDDPSSDPTIDDMEI